MGMGAGNMGGGMGMGGMQNMGPMASQFRSTPNNPALSQFN